MLFWGYETFFSQKRQFGREKPQSVDLIPSDREIIEELRHQLRTQPRNGTTSVLEAIGDPEVSENLIKSTL